MPYIPKRQCLKLLLMLAVLAIGFAAGTAWAERLRVFPVPPHVTPQWTAMPDLPQMSYAPNLPTDLFRYKGRYYLYWEGIWYRGNKIKGPWNRLEPPPAILQQINAGYFKTLPKPGAQPPGAAAPPGEVLLTPEGKPAAPPSPPMVPEPTAPAPPTPPETAQPPQPVTPPPEATQPPPSPSPSPETQESAPLAVPEGAMPKAM